MQLQIEQLFQPHFRHGLFCTRTNQQQLKWLVNVFLFVLNILWALSNFVVSSSFTKQNQNMFAQDDADNWSVNAIMLLYKVFWMAFFLGCEKTFKNNQKRLFKQKNSFRISLLLSPISTIVLYGSPCESHSSIILHIMHVPCFLSQEQHNYLIDSNFTCCIFYFSFSSSWKNIKKIYKKIKIEE